MKAHWETSTSGSIALTEEDPEVFEVYLHWLYFETLPVRNDSAELQGNNEYAQLAKAYALGEFLQDVNFRDAVLDAMLIKSRSKVSEDGRIWFPGGPAIRYIYEGTPESSAARRLLVDLYTYHGHGDWLKGWAVKDDMPKQFLLDLAIAALTERSRPSASLAKEKGACEYHEHRPDPHSCYKNHSASKRGKTPHIASGDPQKTN
ncbi:hypothetical protein J3E68DRAFT_442661 [Trichoderma sp. SZMC 28012]